MKRFFNSFILLSLFASSFASSFTTSDSLSAIIGEESAIILTVDGMSFYVPERESSDSIDSRAEPELIVADSILSSDSVVTDSVTNALPLDVQQSLKYRFFEKWHLEEVLSFSLNHGNDENLTLKNSGSLMRDDSLISMDLNYKFVYETKNKKETGKRFNAEFKLDFLQYHKWSPFVGLTYLTNKYKGYDHKISSLLGGKRILYRKPKVCDYSVSLALTYDYVDYTPEKTDLDSYNLRLSLRPKMKQRLGPTAKLVLYAFYQPSLINFSDYILSATMSIDCHIRKWFSLTFRVEDEYHSWIPSEDYEHNDLSTEVGLKFRF